MFRHFIDKSYCQLHTLHSILSGTMKLSSSNDDNSFQIQIHKFSGSLNLWAAKSKSSSVEPRTLCNVLYPTYHGMSFIHMQTRGLSQLDKVPADHNHT